MGVNLTSDNVVGAAPQIAAAIHAVCTGTAPGYGADAHTQAVERQLARLFGKDDLVAFPVATGTAANALALAGLGPPPGAVLCHDHAHITVDECGAPEFFTHGAKLITMPGEGAKLEARALAEKLASIPEDFVHTVQPAAVSITQATEAGRVYTPDEVRAISEVAKGRGLSLHMDGARFANALASLGCSPAEITWQAGVDVLCFGATKNGAMAAEAVVFFKPELARDFIFRRKRSGHLFSKTRLISAQLEAYFTDDLWLELARHANRMAGLLAAELQQVPGLSFRDPVEANEIFVAMPDPLIKGLQQAGHAFYRWEGQVCRLVTSFATTQAEIGQFSADLRRLSG